MTPHPQPDNCIHGKLCTDLNNYIKSVLPSGKYAIQKCLDINYQSCPHYCASHSSTPTDREVVYSYKIKPLVNFPCIARRELALKDFENNDESQGWTSLNFRLEYGDEIRVYRTPTQEVHR